MGDERGWTIFNSKLEREDFSGSDSGSLYSVQYEPAGSCPRRRDTDICLCQRHGPGQDGSVVIYSSDDLSYSGWPNGNGTCVIVASMMA
jgi:hypothetical protein